MAPVLFVDYNDESIFVGNRLKHRFMQDKTHTITKQDVLHHALNEELYPPRTTRHFFPFIKKDYPIELNRLKPTKSNDISYLISNNPKEFELEHTLNFTKGVTSSTPTVS